MKNNEKALAFKANCEMVKKIDSDVKTLDKKGEGLVTDISKLGKHCEMLYTDNTEKQKIVKNIVTNVFVIRTCCS